MTSTRLTVPLDVHAWLADRRAQIDTNLKNLAKQARQGTLPHAQIENGTLSINCLPASTKSGVDQLILDRPEQR